MLRVSIIIFLVLVLVALVSIALWDTPIVAGVQCDRERGSCQIFRRLMAGKRQFSLPIDSVHHAHVQATRSPRGWVGISLQLSTTSGDYYVSDYEFRDAAERDAARINEFLDHSAQKQIIVRNGSLTLYIFALAFGAVTLAFIVRVLLLKQRQWRSDPGASK